LNVSFARCAKKNEVNRASRRTVEAVLEAKETWPMNDLNLMDIAREANKRGDADTLRDALSLLERLLPIVSGRIETFMEFCTELDNANNKLAPKAFTLARRRWRRADCTHQAHCLVVKTDQPVRAVRGD
jgi:hypothetical protein